MVALGTLASAFWILSVNSWMQTPQGHAVDALGRFVPADWWAIVFNPSFPYRFVHMVLAAYLAVAFVVGGVAAWHLLRDGTDPAARRAFSMAMWMAALVAPAQIVAGDLHGLNTLEHQPVKVAAMEGHFRRGGDNQPLVLVGIPDAEAGRVHYAVEIPYLGSLILTHSLHGQIAGLLEFPEDQRPPVGIPFWSFRIMVATGFAMAALGLWSLWLRARGRLFDDRRLLRASVLMGPSGIVAILAGWVTTEVGRQPWTVYGLLRTSESLSPVDAPAVAASLAGFVIVYMFVFGAGLFYMLRLMARPVPVAAPPAPPAVGPSPLLAPHFAPDLLADDDGAPVSRSDGGGRG
jgi:cytochrome d ubiquinol oxidase subunit I